MRVDRAHRQAMAETRATFAKPDRPGILDHALKQTLGPLAGLGAEIGLNTGRALVESSDVRRETLKGFRDLPAGLVMGTVGAVTQPGKTLKGLAKQYEHTYAPALEGHWGEFRKRMGEKGSGGAVQVLADGSIVIGGAGAGLGRLARAGRLGAKAEAVMRAPRPHLRYSGGAEGRLEQDIPHSYFAARRARRRDTSRMRTFERRYREAGNEDFAPTLRPRSRPGRRAGVLTGGEVVARGGLELRGLRGRAVVVPAPRRLRTAERLQRKQAAREKGQRRIVQLEEQRALQRVYAENVGLKVGSRIGNLTAREQKAFRYVYGGLMAAKDAPTALRHLRERRAQIIEHRRELTMEGKRRSLPGPRRKHNEELRVIDDLISRLEGGEPVLTDALSKASGRMRRVEVAVARGRPDLSDVPLPGRVSQTQLRRYAPQAEFIARMDQRARAEALRRGERAPDGLLPAIRAGETPGSYVERVGLRNIIVRAQREGMLRPGYFPSERRFTTRFSDSAIGGSRGLVDDRNYSGALFRRGEEDTRPEVLLAGLMRGVKRRHNINLIAEQVQKHAIDLGATQREIKAVGRRRAKGELEKRRAADAAAARELGVSLKDLEAIGKSIARNHRRTQKHAREVYAPRMEGLREQVRGFSERIGEVNAAYTDPTEQAYFDELVSARNRLDGRVEQAKGAGELERWRELRADRDQVQQELSALVDQRMRLFAESNRLHREMETAQDELNAIYRGDRITGAPERDAKDVVWYHGTHRDYGAELPKAPEQGAGGNDLGVYLTSDPKYGAQYGGLNPDQPGYQGRGRGRRLEIYVQPRKTLETRFGHVQPQDVIEILDRLIERGERASEAVVQRWAAAADRTVAIKDRMGAILSEAKSADEAPAGVFAFGSSGARRRALDLLGGTRFEEEFRNLAAELEALNVPANVRDTSRFRAGERLRAFRDRLNDPNDPLALAASGRGPREYETIAPSGVANVHDALDEWRGLDEAVMRGAPSEIGEIEGVAAGTSVPYYTQMPTRETLLELGFDSVRKVDVRADTLVVVDERILRRAPATERMDELMAAEADLRTAHEGLRQVREAEATDLLEDAIRVRDEAEARFEKAREGARLEIAERAGQLAVQAAHERLARDSTPGPGRTIKELTDDLEHARVDPAEVMFFNPGRIYRDYAGSPVPEERFGFESSEQGNRGLLEALNANVLRGDEVARLVRARPEDFQQVTGWVAVPKAVGEEIMASTTPERLLPRLWDISKGKFSRVLLGLGNVSWLAFQVGSNAFLSGLFGKVGPLDMWRAQKWWNGLSEDERASLRPILGQSAHHMDFDRRYLGASAANSTIVNAKRAMEKSAWWQAARKGNPIDLMFRLDAHQNLFFRRALLYSEAKRRMFDRMGESTHDIVNLQDRIMGTLTKRADDQLMGYLEDKATLELHGRKVDELLGDYLTYTHNERAILQRFVMFYGFVRHSTRLALWTLPTRHPITVGILTKLSLLGQAEAEEILGGEQLPWGLGKFYFRGSDPIGRIVDALPGVDVPDNDRVMEIDLARMSPATNAFTDIRQANQIARVFPPFLSLIIGHIAEKNLNTGKDWQVRGMTRETLKRFSPLDSPYTLMDHVKILAGELSTTIPPVRYAERVLFVGPQGDDASLLFGAAPTGYREDEIVKSIDKQRRRTLERPVGQRLLDIMFPMLPRPSEDPRIVRQREQRQGEANKAREAFERRGRTQSGSDLQRFRQTVRKRHRSSHSEDLRRFRETLRGGG